MPGWSGDIGMASAAITRKKPTANRVAFDIEAQLLMVLSGAYLGVLPAHLARIFEQQGRLRRLPIADEAYSAEIEIATRAGEQAANVAHVRDAIIRAHRSHL